VKIITQKLFTLLRFIMKTLLLIPLLSFFMLSCDGISGLDIEGLEEMIQSTAMEADSTNMNAQRTDKGIRVQISQRNLDRRMPFVVINDMIVDVIRTKQNNPLAQLDPAKITKIDILKDSNAEEWFEMQNIKPEERTVGIVFITTDQENWNKGFDLKRVK